LTTGRGTSTEAPPFSKRMFGAVKKLPRLGQWNGRKRSSRQEPFLRRLGQRRVLLRIAIVWLTTVAITFFAVWWGPPMPYRLGECYPYDLRVRVDFELLNHVQLIDETPPGDAKSGTHKPLTEKYPRGKLLVPRGQPIQERQLEILKEEHRAYLKVPDPDDPE